VAVSCFAAETLFRVGMPSGMRILIFQHLPVEHVGVFARFWQTGGCEMHVVEFDKGDAIPRLADFDLLVVMGGPMDVWQEDIHPWLVPEKAAIKCWVAELDKPYLGICLGHQLLADALGGIVSMMKRPEVGLAKVELSGRGGRDALFQGIHPTINTFQWHSAEVSVMPEGGEVLAANAACAVQAMRCGKRAYGLQYHIEITDQTVGDWQQIPEYEGSLIQALGAEKAAGLANAVTPHLAGFERVASIINDNLMSLVRS
jgi:GMP synthase-like glutamine amidotransferase